MNELIIGIIGMFLILIAFVLDEFNRKFNSENVWYNVMNFIGSGFLMIYAYALRGWPFLLINGVWCIVSLFKMLELMFPWHRKF